MKSIASILDLVVEPDPITMSLDAKLDSKVLGLVIITDAITLG